MPTGTRGPRTSSRTGIRIVRSTRIPGQVASMAVAVRKNVLPQRQSQNHLAMRVLTWIKQKETRMRLVYRVVYIGELKLIINY